MQQFLGWVEKFKDRFMASQSEDSAGPSQGLSESPEIDLAREIDHTVNVTMHFLTINLRNNYNLEELRRKMRAFFEANAKDMLE